MRHWVHFYTHTHTHAHTYTNTHTYTRRSLLFRYAFAAAVGKRYYSERIISSSKSTIIEHHRSVQWAEKEYVTLYTLVRQNQSTLRKAFVEDFDEGKELFADYCKMLVYNQQMLQAWMDAP
jgi:hypothetical protein